MFNDPRKEACYIHHLCRVRRKYNSICLYCKYRDKYKSDLAVKLDNNNPSKEIIVPTTLDNSIVAEELAKDYPSYFCYNKELFNSFEKEKESNAIDWIRFLKNNKLLI